MCSFPMVTVITRTGLKNDIEAEIGVKIKTLVFPKESVWDET